MGNIIKHQAKLPTLELAKLITIVALNVILIGKPRQHCTQGVGGHHHSLTYIVCLQNILQDFVSLKDLENILFCMTKPLKNTLKLHRIALW